jgi:hypothetical protein
MSKHLDEADFFAALRGVTFAARPTASAAPPTH